MASNAKDKNIEVRLYSEVAPQQHFVVKDPDWKRSVHKQIQAEFRYDRTL